MQPDINGLLQAIYDEYQKPLRVLAITMGVPEKDVEDVVQETFISYYSHYPLDWPPSRKKHMLATILRNKCIDYFRKYRKEWLILDSDQFAENQEMTFRYSRDLIDYIINKEVNKDVEEAFKQLKGNMQVAARLRLIEGISENDIAEMLEITPVACRARVSRARKMLRKLLGSKYGV